MAHPLRLRLVSVLRRRAIAPDARRVSLYLGAVPVLDDGTDW